MDSRFTIIDTKQLAEIAENAEKIFKQMQPQFQQGLEIALKVQKDIEPYLAQILKQFRDVQPFILESSRVYLPPPQFTKKTVPQKSGNALVPGPKKLGKRIVLIAGNSFRYEKKPLRAISLNSKPGKFLYAVLSSAEHFVTDEVLFDSLGVEDVRALSWIRRDLKDSFENNRLILILERRKNPNGYILIDIQKQR